MDTLPQRKKKKKVFVYIHKHYQFGKIFSCAQHKHKKNFKGVFYNLIFENKMALLSIAVFHKHYCTLYEVYVEYRNKKYICIDRWRSFFNTTSYEVAMHEGVKQFVDIKTF